MLDVGIGIWKIWKYLLCSAESSVLMAKNLKAVYSWKNLLFIWSKISIYLSPVLHKGCLMSKLYLNTLYNSAFPVKSHNNNSILLFRWEWDEQQVPDWSARWPRGSGDGAEPPWAAARTRPHPRAGPSRPQSTSLQVQIFWNIWKYQCCGTVTIFYGSGSDFWKVMVPVPVPTFEKVMVPVPVPAPVSEA